MRGCRNARGRIERAVDGLLSLEERFALDEHLAHCPLCRDRFERARAVQELLGQRPAPPVEHLDVDRAVATIRNTIDATRGKAARPLPRASRRRWVAAAAVVVLGVSAALWFAWDRDPAADDADEGLVAEGDPTPKPRPDTPHDSPPPAVEDTTGDALDPRRLELVREDVRNHLQVAFADFRSGDDPLSFADRFDAATRELRRDEWPVLRIVEDLLSDPEEHTVRSAARYVGVRGDRASALRLGAARPGSPAREAIVLALGDLGAPAVVPLVAALADEDVEDLAAEQLGRVGGRHAVAALEEEIRGASSNSSRRDFVLLPSLAAAGPEALESMLRLAAEDAERADAVLAHLPDVRDADAAFARIVRASSHGHDASLLFDAAARLQTPAALAWVEECTESYRDRPDALLCLAQWDGPAPLEVVLRLDARGTVPDEDLFTTLAALIDRDPARLTEFVAAAIEARAVEDVERLLALLVATENPWASESLVLIVLADLLDSASRQWAALALGEFGDADAAERLLAHLAEIERDESRLLAACLISIHAHLGPAGVSRALEGLAVKSSRRVLTALSDVDPSGTSAVGLHRVARALETARLPKPRRSSL